MNVYDFDKTIYDGNSTIDFYIFEILRKPLLLRYLPQQLMCIVLYHMKIINKKKYKEGFFSFIKGIKNIDDDVIQFWNTKEEKIKKWYLKQKKETDVIISASPDWLLYPIAAKLNIILIATKVNKKTGVFKGENCYGEEKVNRFHKEINKKIDNFYSDHVSDIYMALKSKNAWLVKGNKIEKWKI